MAYLKKFSVSAQSPTLTTSGVDSTGADFIAIAVATYAVGSDSTTPTDSVGGNSNTWTSVAAATTDGANARIHLWYSIPAHVGAGHTFTFAGTVPGAGVIGFSGALQSSPVDQTNNGSGAGTTIPTGSVTPSVALELMIAAAAVLNNNEDASSIDSGFTLKIDLAQVAGTASGISLAYFIDTGTTTKSPIFTITGGGGAGAAQIATFKAASGGGATNWGPWLLSERWNRIVQ